MNIAYHLSLRLTKSDSVMFISLIKSQRHLSCSVCLFGYRFLEGNSFTLLQRLVLIGWVCFGYASGKFFEISRLNLSMVSSKK